MSHDRDRLASKALGTVVLLARGEGGLRDFVFAELRRNYYPRPASLAELSDREADERRWKDVNRELSTPEGKAHWEKQLKRELKIDDARVEDDAQGARRAEAARRRAG
jgi:hypothetical protein